MVFHLFDFLVVDQASADLSGAGLLAIDLLDVGSLVVDQAAVDSSAGSLAVDLLDVGLSAVDLSVHLTVDPASPSLL